jgi:hypothetical protein
VDAGHDTVRFAPGSSLAVNARRFPGAPSNRTTEHQIMYTTNSNQPPRALLLAASVFLGFLLHGCASEPPAPATAQQTLTVTAKVLAVDTDARLLVLQGKEDVVTIEVPESVSNLASIKVGDQLAVTYYSGLAAVFASKSQGDDDKNLAIESASANSPPGAPPGRARGHAVTARVKIKSIDRDFQTVTFMGPRGLERTVGVNDPKMQAFVAQLKAGDEVDLTYFEAVAAQVVPTQ